MSTGSFCLQDPSGKPLCAIELLAVQLEPGRGSVLTPAWSGSQQQMLLMRNAQKPGREVNSPLSYSFLKFCLFSNEEGRKVRSKYADLDLFCIQHYLVPLRQAKI